MRFSTFVKALDALKENMEKTDELYQLGIDTINYSRSMENAIINLLEDEFPESIDDINYFMWELDFGKEYTEGCSIDEFGRPIRLKDYMDLWTWCITRQYDVTYLKNGDYNLVAFGTYRGIHFWVRENRWLETPYYCAYIDVTGSDFHGQTEFDDDLCHGGVTWAKAFLPWAFDDNYDEDDPGAPNWYIGWDYNHCGDELIDRAPSTIVEDICEAIDKLAERR